MFQVTMTGELPCGGWDCDCAFKRQRGCCCVANDAFQLEESVFMRLVGLWQGVSALSSQIDELTGSYYHRDAAREISDL